MDVGEDGAGVLWRFCVFGRNSCVAIGIPAKKRWVGVIFSLPSGWQKGGREGWDGGARRTSPLLDIFLFLRYSRAHGLSDPELDRRMKNFVIHR